MPKPNERRKARLRAALALSGLTMKEWATAHGVSYGHLRFVLLGERESPRLDREIEQFIKQYKVA